MRCCEGARLLRGFFDGPGAVSTIGKCLRLSLEYSFEAGCMVGAPLCSSYMLILCGLASVY